MPTGKTSRLQIILCSIGIIVVILAALPFVDWGDSDPFPQLNWYYVAAVFLVAVLYPVPIIIGHIRNHRNLPALTAINLGLGWTGIGWVCALAWSLYRERS